MAATPSPSSSPPTQPSESQSLLVKAAKPILLAIPVQTQKKAQAVQWTPEETTSLIQAYQDKWYSLKRGQLKAHQWEEVAVTVAARCGYDEATKTSTQCRHKMEKLRKRFRAEKRKGGGRSSAWPFFGFMDRMERGPRPISARPVNMVRFQNPGESGEEEDCGDNHRRVSSRSRSINSLIMKPHTIVNIYPGSPPPPSRARKGAELAVYKDGEFELEEENGFGKKRLLLSGLAAEMRAFEQRIAWVENKKMEMMRDTQKMRMEMESKRLKMIHDSQAKIVETIYNGGPLKKIKIRTTSDM
uniref:Myb-like domain-containing protein n=1 Tax=Kalanchoe fedtschenkoi TaxID=63787 RepID=A0A7N0T4T7_KALFE